MPLDNGEKNKDDLLQRIEKQLDEIEMGEILQEMTKESLEEKGFIGDKPIAADVNIIRKETEKEHLLFEPNVDYERLPDNTRLDGLDAESLSHLRDVKKGQLIATREKNDAVQFYGGINVEFRISGNREIYGAKITGKVVIIKDRLHIIPSSRDSSVRLSIDEKKLHVYADFIPGLGEGKTLTSDMVREELAKNGITYGIDNEAIEKAVDKAETIKKTLPAVKIAFGVPPERGEDGRIEYGFDTEQKEESFRILPDGRIDYHASKNIIMVEKGQFLARIIGPTVGKQGIDVFGNHIPGESGLPATLTPGRGVKKSEDGSEFVAECSGSVILNGSVIEVVNTYIVNGDVDYSTGNIVFNGNVVINGIVPDGFEVKAEGDVIVAKIVEAAKIEAGRDVIIKGGVQGKGKGLISAGRDVRIGYAQNARLEAQGNIYIDNFAINSYIFTCRYLIMKEKRGSVIGGEIVAQRGIEVKSLGSESGVKTFVEVGSNYLMLRKKAELDKAIGFCEENIAKIEGVLKTLHTRIKEGKNIDEKTKDVVARAVEKKNDLERRRSVMIARRSDLLALAREKETCEIKVSQTCYQDVFIKIKECKTVVTKPRTKVRFYEDRKSGEVAAGTY